MAKVARVTAPITVSFILQFGYGGTGICWEILILLWVKFEMSERSSQVWTERMDLIYTSTLEGAT